jgi:hypothetical protein
LATGYAKESRVIKWDPYVDLIADGVKVPAKLGLAHEMGHAIQCNNSPSAVEKISDDDLEDLGSVSV